MFDLSRLTPNQRAIVEGALARCDFPWERLQDGLRAAFRKQIAVRFEDLSGFSSVGRHTCLVDSALDVDVLVVAEQPLGLAWRDGQVWLDNTLEADPELAGQVFIAEGAHMVDFFLLVDEDRDAITTFYHGGVEDADEHGWLTGDYYDMVGEAFMFGFMTAFSDYQPLPLPFTHDTTPTITVQVRDYLLGEAHPGRWTRMAFALISVAAIAAIVLRGCIT